MAESVTPQQMPRWFDITDGWDAWAFHHDAEYHAQVYVLGYLMAGVFA